MKQTYHAGGLSWYHSGHGGYYSTQGWTREADARQKIAALERRFNFSSATFQCEQLDDGKYHLLSSMEMIGRMQGKGIGQGPTPG